MEETIKGRIHIRIAGFFFFLSALYQILSIMSPVALMGQMRSGTPAILYHLMYVLMFLFMGIALWDARKWGVKITLISTIYLTLERLILIFNERTMQLHIDQLLWHRPDIEIIFQMKQIYLAFVITNILFIVAWWGFALYIYFRRAYFVK